MWNNKKIKVLDNYSIGGTKKGDVITVKGDYGCNSGQILTINNQPYKNGFNDWSFPPNDGKYWEIIEEITPKYVVGKWYKREMWDSIGIRCSKVDSKIHYDAYISSTGELKAQIGTYDFADNLVEVDKTIIDKYLKPATTIYKFEIGQEVNPVKDKGNYYCSPESFYKLSTETQKQYQGGTNVSPLSKIRERTVCNNTNWYLVEDYGSWVSEEALEAISSIPEYVECVVSKQSHSIVGRIYKTNKTLPTNIHSHKLVCNLVCGGYQPGVALYSDLDCYKPSTKEAYEAQKDKKARIAEVPESLVGRYIKTLVNKPMGGDNVKAGDIGKVITDNGDRLEIDFPTHSNYAWSNLKKTPEKYELMPEGWFPESILPITKTSTAMKYPHPIGTKVMYQELEHVIEAYLKTNNNSITALISGPKGIHNGAGNWLEDEFGNTIHSDGKNNKHFVLIEELSLVKETLPFYKFKVGDRVIGNSKASTYSYTTTGVTGVVVESYSTFFRMKIDLGFTNAGKSFDVSYEKFDLYQPDKYPATLKESYLISPFNIEAINSRISEIKQEEGDVSIGKVKRMLIPVKTI